MVRNKFSHNLNIAEKICVILVFFIAVLAIYVCMFYVSKFLFGTTEMVDFKAAMTFSLSASSMFLVILLYSDWREKYAVETLDKDLREIKVLVSDVNFRINQFPSSESVTDKKYKEEFYQLYWKLRTINSNLTSFDLKELVDYLDLYLNESLRIMNQILVKKQNADFYDISEEIKELSNNLNIKIDLAMQRNLKVKF